MTRGWQALPQEIQTVGQEVIEYARGVEQDSERRRVWQVRIMAGLIANVAFASLMARGMMDTPQDVHVAAQGLAACAPEDCSPLPVEDFEIIKPGNRRAKTRPITITTTSSSSSTSTTVQPQPPVSTTLPLPVVAAATREKSPELDIDPQVEAAMDSMKLTVEGYQEFLQTINYSYFDYAQQFIEFNPHEVPIAQNPTQFITLHFTAFYRNADGPSTSPKGDMVVQPFVQGLAGRGDEDSPPDHKCCGINATNDRNGNVYALAPAAAKLRHNKGFDSVTTGIEFEAATQAGITTKQYETGAFYLIAEWQSDANLRTKQFKTIVKGHGETRDELQLTHPELDDRNDFNYGASEKYRQNIQAFIDENPQILKIAVNLR